MQTITFSSTCVNGITYVPPEMTEFVDVEGKTVFLLPVEAELMSDCIYYGSLIGECIPSQDIGRIEELGLVVKSPVIYVSGSCDGVPNWEQSTDQYILTPLGYQVAFNLFVRPEETVESKIAG